jgi:hypothetical protein
MKLEQAAVIDGAVERHLRRALDRPENKDWTFEQAAWSCAQGRWGLYRVMDDDRCVGAGIVAVQEYGLRRVLEVVAFGADDHTKTWQEVLHSVQELAKSLNCQAIRTEGRPGWERVLRMQRINVYELEV